jgi:glucose-1-phosphate thymidylyltransferase
MKALILAAGYATRLYPITKEYPKPLLKVNKRPIIDYIVEKLEKIGGIDEIIVVTNSKFMPQFRKWQAGAHIQKRTTLIDDLTKDNESRRGAIGDIDFAIGKLHIEDDLLIIGGDNLFDGNLGDFMCFVNRHKEPVIGAYNIRNKVYAKKYGVINIDKKGRLIDFQEKPKNPKSALVAMCLYYFPGERLRLIREYMDDNKTKKTDATGLYIDWLRNKFPVYAFVFNGSWYDIGDHKFYDAARQLFVKKGGQGNVRA